MLLNKQIKNCISRVIARELELSQARVLEVLLDDRLHLHHYSRSARVFPNNDSKRMQSCEWLRHQRTAHELFLNNVLCTREAYFAHESVFSLRNSQLWATVAADLGTRSPSASMYGLESLGTLLWPLSAS
jgi:hypothetical protein